MGELKPSIIVTARNYGRFLKECLSSCLSQTSKPLEVIYSDDFSDDNSLNVAKQFQNRVIILPHTKHLGVVAARNHGAEISRGNILIHVDGDDILPNNFVQKHLEALEKNPESPLVYCAAQTFGDLNCFWDVPDNFRNLFLWDRNFINTSCAIRREFFLAAGKWQENKTKTSWDWDLALRTSKLGTPCKSEAVLLYRQHDYSWSKKYWKKIWPITDIFSPFRYDRTSLEIGCVYSGRLPGILPKWINSINENVKYSGKVANLTILDNSNNTRINSRLWKECEKYTSGTVKIIKYDRKLKYKSEIERRDEVAKLLADAYSILLNTTTSDLMLFLEDDVIFENKYQLKKLLVETTKGKHKIKYGCIGGAYRGRHPQNKKKFVVDFHGGLDVFPKEKLYNIRVIGTGCLLFWKEFAPDTVQPFININEATMQVPAHDWWFTDNIFREKAIHTEVVCRHYKTDRIYV